VCSVDWQGGHPHEQPGKVSEFDIDQGKLEKSGKLWFACGVLLQLR